MRRFVVGDIHGRADALRGLLKEVGFDYDTDKLIVLGDVVDGGEDVKGAVEELLKIKNLVYVLGNHDEWFLDFIRTGEIDDMWYYQGGDATLESYKGGIPESHKKLFVSRAKLFHIEDGVLFVHGGLEEGKVVSKQSKGYLLWDRSMFEKFRKGIKFPYSKIFVGHTPTSIYGAGTLPIFLKSGESELFMLDTGAGWRGKLTIMDIDSEVFWQSDALSPSSRVRGGGW